MNKKDIVGIIVVALIIFRFKIFVDKFNKLVRSLGMGWIIDE